jgi:hypothetical protein
MHDNTNVKQWVILRYNLQMLMRMPRSTQVCRADDDKDDGDKC